MTDSSGLPADALVMTPERARARTLCCAIRRALEWTGRVPRAGRSDGRRWRLQSGDAPRERRPAPLTHTALVAWSGPRTRRIAQVRSPTPRPIHPVWSGERMPAGHGRQVLTALGVKTAAEGVLWLWRPSTRPVGGRRAWRGPASSAGQLLLRVSQAPRQLAWLALWLRQALRCPTQQLSVPRSGRAQRPAPATMAPVWPRPRPNAQAVDECLVRSQALGGRRHPAPTREPQQGHAPV